LQTNRADVYNEKTFNLHGVRFTRPVQHYSDVTSSLFVYMLRVAQFVFSNCFFCINANVYLQAKYTRILLKPYALCRNEYSTVYAAIFGLGGSGPPPNTWFHLSPQPKRHLDRISVFLQLTYVSRWGGTCHRKIAHSSGGIGTIA